MTTKRPLYKRFLSLGFRIVKNWRKTPYFLVSLPFSLIIIFLFPILKIKLIRLCSDRIGHYALNTELLLCYLDEIKSSQKKVKYIYYCIDSPVCNDQLHLMWKRIIPILPFSKVAEQINTTLISILGNRYKDFSLQVFETSH